MSSHSSLGPLGETAWSALQASVSVCLVLLYGGLLSKYGFLSKEGEKQISHIGTTFLLPALLFTEMGPNATLENLRHFVALPIACLCASFLSFLFGLAGTYFFSFPLWVTPGLVFNNAVSLPLLLIKALAASGGLDEILDILPGDSAKSAVSRARTYILINALASNIIRFAFGPMLLKAKQSQDETERTPLLQSAQEPDAKETVDSKDLHPYHHAWPGVHGAWHWIEKEFNPPLFAGFLAILVGVIPSLRWFVFSGPLYGSFTQSLENVGELYTSLQMLALGAKLQSKKGGETRIGALLYLFAWRFLLLPAIAISIVYALRTKTNILLRDPLLDFVIASSTFGPPAITLSAIAQMARVSDKEDAAIAKMLTISYVVTPIVSLSVAGLLYSIHESYELQ